MDPVARDEYVAAMVDGSGKYRSVLFGEDDRVRQQRSAGKQAADFDPCGHGLKYGKTVGIFCGQIASRFLEDVGICQKFMFRSLAKSEQLPYRAIRAGGREQNVGVEENPHYY